MKIALIMGQIHADAQKRVIKSIYKLCKENKDDLHLFALYSSNEERYNLGEIEFINRINLDIYDGIILYSETLYSLHIRERLLNKIQFLMDKCVFIDSYVEGAININSDNKDSMEQMTTHLIKEHNIKTINFVGGPKSSEDSKLRQEGVECALKKHGLKLEKDRIYNGTFFVDSGIKAVEYFNKMELEKVDAYVCANDKMALGVISSLKKLGYKIPSDIIVTGFDNIEQTNYYSPQITSIERNEEKIGMLAYETLKNLVNKKEVKYNNFVKATPIYRESCCKHNKVSVDAYYDYYQNYLEKNVNEAKYSTIINDSSTEFIAAKTITELCNQLPKYLREFEVPEFCICIDTNVYDNEVTVPIHYIRRNDIVYKEVIKKAQITPNIKEKNNGEFLIIKPLHYLDDYFGYVINSNFLLPIQTELYHTFLSTIENAMEAVFNYRKMNNMVKKIQETSNYDALTGLYNRTGFFEKADTLFEYAKIQDQQIYIIFSDLDGLKQVNDNLGHKIGDAFICDYANILTRCTKELKSLAMRFGGDEFVIFGIGQDKITINNIIDNIKSSISQINDESDAQYFPYKLGASIGSYIVEPTTKMSLLSLIEQADKEMYIEKKKKKMPL